MLGTSTLVMQTGLFNPSDLVKYCSYVDRNKLNLITLELSRCNKPGFYQLTNKITKDYKIRFIYKNFTY